jgi:hypothetical protein
VTQESIYDLEARWSHLAMSGVCLCTQWKTSLALRIICGCNIRSHEVQVEYVHPLLILRGVTTYLVTFNHDSQS